MTIITKESRADQTLLEYRVGKAGSTCLYPGIAQCFAIAGWCQTSMVCTHVSPGATAQDMTDTFASLRDLGGNWVADWYVVGPFSHHFRADYKAIWSSVKKIGETFDKELKGCAARRWILDASQQRDAKVMIDGYAWPLSGLDIMAQHRAALGGIGFTYKESRSTVVDWNDFNHDDFMRF